MLWSYLSAFSFVSKYNSLSIIRPYLIEGIVVMSILEISNRGASLLNSESYYYSMKSIVINWSYTVLFSDTVPLR